MSKSSNPSELHLLETLKARLLVKFPNGQSRGKLDGVFDDLQLFRQLLSEQGGDAQRAAKVLLQRAIDTLREKPLDAEKYVEYANVLQAYFLTSDPIQVAAQQLNMGQATFYRRRDDALPYLAETLARLEIEFQAERQQQRVQQLPDQSYVELIGKSGTVTDLCKVLRLNTAPWLIAITGIGGIGKTTLADAAIRQMAEDSTWVRIAWLRAPQSITNVGIAIRPQMTPALAVPVLLDGLAMQLLDEPTPNGRRTPAEILTLLESLLKRAAHLIVIDNLESELDLKELLPTLRRLANPSKFLITSRSSFFEASDLHHRVVPELEEAEALALLRAEAQLRNIPPVLAASDTELQPIYATVGGNPLALKLVCGQLRLYSLSTVLEDLYGARRQNIEELYRHIYWRAWNLLGVNAQSLLLAMPLVSEQGGDLALLKATCDLPEETLCKALEILIGLNLVEVRGDLHKRRYTIHSLTRTFLHDAVIKLSQLP
ncbi:MAG: NB-ARC domain-containing protein [Caldilineaceae bacterium]